LSRNTFFYKLRLLFYFVLGSESQEDSQESLNKDDQDIGIDSENENEYDKEFINDSSQDFPKSDKK